MSTLDFDATTITPAKPFEVLPKGTYEAIISASELKDTKAGTGQYLECEYTIVGGEYDGRRVWSRSNLVNPNQTAEEIGRRELSAICYAVGVLKVGDSNELHDRPLKIEVGIEKNKETGNDTNRVRAWMTAGAAAPAPTPARTPAPSAKKAPPWATKAKAA